MTKVSERPGVEPGEEIGFVGLGVMGQPMALNLCRTLYGESVELGNGRLDMMSVVAAIEARTAALGRS